MRFGTPSRRSASCPGSRPGELHFSIGYSEPEAGHRPGLAAHPRGPGWRRVRDQRPEDVDQPDPVRGLRLARLPDRPRRAPAQGPVHHHRAHRRGGFSWTPVRTVAGVTTSATYYGDVRVPAANLVGEENKGWPLITNQLNHERVALTSAAPLLAALADVTDWAQATKLGRRPAGHRRRVGPAQPGPGARQGRVAQADELADRRQAGDARARPPRRRPRSTAPSSTIEAYRL